MVIDAKPSYNLLIGREWLHGVGVVPSSMHQRLVIWREDGIVENKEAYQGYYMAEANTADHKHFDRNLENISPCQPSEDTYINLEEAFVTLNLHASHGFIWDVQPLDNNGGIRPTGWVIHSEDV